MARISALAAALVVLLAPAASAKTVRVFTVGPRFDPSWVDSREHFEAKLDGMLAPTRRLGRDRDLAVLPEDLGLLAAFSGPRGAPARSASSLTEAIAALTGTYSVPIAHYSSRYPELAGREVPTRLLALALTDTFGHVGVETFSALADRYDLWLEAGVNMAREWRVVCSTAAIQPPPGQRCDAVDAALVSRIGEPGRGYAYEATTPEPVNMALLFDPDGKLVAKQPKAYLTPTELPGQLDLVPGDVHGLTAVDTPVGRLGFVTSKDAFMPDVTGRLDDAGVEILVQPEFFVGDTIRTTGMWAADTLKASGYSDLLRHPSFTAMALPELTGDVYEFSADAQSHIAVRGGAAGALVGQPPAPGLAQVQPWIVGEPGGTIARRRAQLGAAGEQAIGAGTQPEGVLSQDVEVGTGGGERRRPAPRRTDRPIAPSRFDQRHVTLAAQGKRVYAAWEEAGRVMTARSRDRGRHFGPARIRGEGTHPSLSARASGPVWLAFRRSDGKVVAAEGDAAPQVLAPGGGEQERPAIAATPDGDAFAVWLDDRGGEVGVYGAPVGDVPMRLDQGRPVPLAEQLDNSWAPSVAAQGRKVLVSWVDFRAYQWDVYARASNSRGKSFAPQVRVNDSDPQLEALDDTPRATYLRHEPYVAWTDFRKAASPALHPLYDVFGAVVGQPNRRLDGDGGRQRDAFAPAVAPVRGGDVAVAWQAHRGRTADIRLGLVRSGASRRVDDAGTRSINSWRPALARSGPRRVVVAWEDDRDGPTNVFARTLVLPSPASP